MRQNAKAFFKQSGSVFSDRMAHPTVFIVDQSRLPKELVSQFHCGCDTGIAINDPFHPVESPKQIDRRGPGGCQDETNFLEVFFQCLNGCGQTIARAKRNAHCRGDDRHVIDHRADEADQHDDDIEPPD